MFYAHESHTGKQHSLKTRDRKEAQALLHARNESARMPSLNLELGRAYLAGHDPRLPERPWDDVMTRMLDSPSESTRTDLTPKSWT
jgi:hypothetical protein